MKRSNIKSLMFSTIVVLAIIAIVGGSTYAYFQWTTADDQRTNVNVVIETGGIEMIISPESTVVSGLRPVSDCTVKNARLKTVVTIKNKTGTLAVPSFKLKVKVLDKNGNGVPESALKHIHYSVWEHSNDTPDSYLESVSTCRYGSTFHDASDNVTPLFNEVVYGYSGLANDTIASAGTFSGISTTGEWSVLPRNGFLPREYWVDPTDPGLKWASGISFVGEKKLPTEEESVTTNDFYVYIWIDEEYAITNTGSVVSDPLQDATIYVTWSEESMIQQVTE